jgi:hypothetical protein
MPFSIFNTDYFVFETEDSSLEPLPFNNDAPNILNQREEDLLKIDKASAEQVRKKERWQHQHRDAKNNHHDAVAAVSCNPTPIGSSIQIVGKVQVTENTWYPYYTNILTLLLRTPSHRQQQQQQTIEKPWLSSCFQSLRQEEEEEQAPAQQRLRSSSISTSDDTVDGMLFPAEKLTSSSQGSVLKLTRPDQWNDRFQELADFRQRHGHSLVPHGHPESPSLALWVKRQRKQYKLHKEGKHCTMTAEREAALEQLDFVWDSHAATWDERFKELIAFQSEYGHCKVPTSFPANPQLAVWVKSQRRQFKLFVSGRKSYMSKERTIQLSSLGFVFYPRKLNGGAGMEPN